MSKPILSKIGVFDATTSVTLRFASYDTISGITYVIYDNESGNILTYDDAVTSGSGSSRTFVLSAGTLTNRLEAYYICIRANFSDGTYSEYSDKILFYCHAKPSISLDGVSEGMTVGYPAYSFDLKYAYDSSQGEMINQYQYILYDANKNVIKQSDTLYYSNPLKSFTVDGFDNNTTYYIRATAESINGYELDTGYVSFSTEFTESDTTTNSELILTNNCKEGTIDVEANIYLSATDNIDSVRIKRRKVGTTSWTGLYEEDIDTTSFVKYITWTNGSVNDDTGNTSSSNYYVHSPLIILNQIDHVTFDKSINEFKAYYYGTNEVYISTDKDYGETWETSQAPSDAVFVRFVVKSDTGKTQLDPYEHNGLTVYSNTDGYVVVNYTDKYANGRNQEYEYAAVPVSNNAEQPYIKNTVVSNFDGAVIADKDTIYHITLEPTVSTLTRNHEASVVTTLARKYPYVFYGSKANYYSGEFSGVGIKELDNDVFDIESGYLYRDALVDWLTNEEAKVLKMWDGRAWMICVSGSITIDQSEHVDKGTISFEFVEIGDLNDEDDLYEYDLTNYNAEGVG